jgi:hypothetical protein
MVLRHLLYAAIALMLLQIAGCHYYVNAVPRVIISSEPFEITEQQNNNKQ